VQQLSRKIRMGKERNGGSGFYGPNDGCATRTVYSTVPQSLGAAIEAKEALNRSGPRPRWVRCTTSMPSVATPHTGCSCLPKSNRHDVAKMKFCCVSKGE
jgi:hypothetical protein